MLTVPAAGSEQDLEILHQNGRPVHTHRLGVIVEGEVWSCAEHRSSGLRRKAPTFRRWTARPDGRITLVVASSPASMRWSDAAQAGVEGCGAPQDYADGAADAALLERLT